MHWFRMLYAIVSPLGNTRDAPYRAHYVKTRRYPLNRKYITYRNAASRQRTSHGRKQHASKIEVRPCGFRVAGGHTCRPVDGTSMNEECEAVKTTL